MRSQGKTLLVVVLIVFALALAALACGYLLLGGSEPVASKTILEMNFTQSFPEHVPEDPFARSILDGRPHLGRVVEALGRAADDDDEKDCKGGSHDSCVPMVHRCAPRVGIPSARFCTEA